MRASLKNYIRTGLSTDPEPVLSLSCQPNLIFKWLWFANVVRDGSEQVQVATSRYRLLSSLAGSSRRSRHIFSWDSSGLVNGNHLSPAPTPCPVRASVLIRSCL